MAANPRIDELRKRLEKEPGSRLFAQLAEELRKDGEFDEAIRVCRDGLQKHPAYPSARMTLGRALFDIGDLAAARLEFETVLKGAPDNILASRFLAECLEGLGEAAAAVARYKATLALAPGDKQVLARLQAVEERLKAPAPPAVEPEPVVEAEPPPIPVAQVEEESFELESAHEAAPVHPRPAGAAAPAEEAPVEVEPEVAPIPLAPAEESFELERPFEIPGAAWTAAEPPALQIAAPAPTASAPEPIFQIEARSGEPAPAVPSEAEAHPVAAPAPPKPAEPELTSPTLAELYFNQGFNDKAIEVYRQLIEREPGNERARARLMELQALEQHLRAEEQRGAPAGAAPRAAHDPREARRQAIERTIARLEGFLGAIKRG